MNKILPQKENTRLCFMDMETLNLALHEAHNLPWQIAMIVLENDQVLSKHNFLIKWPFPIVCSKGASEKNHFDAQKIEEEGISPEEIFETFNYELNQSDYIAGHNLVNADAYWVQAFYRKLGHKPYNIYPKMLDTHCILKGIKLEQMPKFKEDLTAWQLRMYHIRKKGLKTNLELMGKEFDIDHDYTRLHDAMNDLELNIKVFDKIKYHLM